LLAQLEVTPSPQLPSLQTGKEYRGNIAMSHDDMITDEIFAALSHCGTKAYLMREGVRGISSQEVSWQQEVAREFKQSALEWLTSKVPEDDCHRGTPSLRVLRDGRYRLLLEPIVMASNLWTQPDALLRTRSKSDDVRPHYIPVRFERNEKPSLANKLLLAYDALIMSRITGNTPQTGKLIHGIQFATTTVSLPRLVADATPSITKFMSNKLPAERPPLVLNRHCPECEFQSRCRAAALEKDDLSLLTNMTTKEREKQNRKGIFTVTQLSYTFRPRRHPKTNASYAAKHQPSLKALAIRKNRIHVVGSPSFVASDGFVYLDVEGVPDYDSYYLIGLRHRDEDGEYIQQSFWADTPSDERDMWMSCLNALKVMKDARLVHYGNYEVQFLRRMKSRYTVGTEDVAFLDKLISSSFNLLSLIYAQLYFPTYSNGLKEIASYLGFAWSESNASGFNAIAWRSEWESTRAPVLRRRLINYNADDCHALHTVANVIADICSDKPSIEAEARFVNVSSLDSGYPLRFGPIQYVVSDFKVINEAAYWDYQRNRVYVRSSKRLKRLSQERGKHAAALLPPNKYVQAEEHRPACCPNCGCTRFHRNGKYSHLIYDLRFSRTGLRRWVVRHNFFRYQCYDCKRGYNELPREARFGSGLKAYVLHQVIDLRVSQRAVSRTLDALFGLPVPIQSINQIKTTATKQYEAAHRAILQRIVSGTLIHADETKITIKREARWVWVFTNLEAVAYVYSDSRDGSTAHGVLHDFRGVLVSDFYAGYDSLDCSHQKCLVHLLRDINEDVLKEPFNEEMKEVAFTFGRLLRPMIETIDRFGLKAHHLRPHKRAVDRFYHSLSIANYRTEVASGHKRRFEKNRGKLFTFLEHDGVPWNNNNAEHAIKAFARLRNAIEGSTTSKGIREYLVLLSISETCRYNGISFLDFLKSGATDIDALI
jgi:predicted RecB family nuclease